MKTKNKSNSFPGNVCGGRGQCRFCKEVVSNVAFHESHTCKNRPERKGLIKRISAWLKKDGITPEDIGVDGPLEKQSDDVLYSIIDDIEEEKVIEQNDRIAKREALKYMLDEEEIDHEDISDDEIERQNPNHQSFVLLPCPNCYQMTNHIGNVCQKCKGKKHK